uniref:Uncharacterized protein n=1 Tax=Panagrolaimus sp. JU765 TaxID=591449 RepID=A0AC34QFU1_9BILA
MIADLSSKDGVPWKFSPSRSDVAQEKKELRTTKRSAIFTDIPCKQEFLAVMDYCDTLGYADIVDYQYIFFLLRLSSEIVKINLDDPYDWEPRKIKPPETAATATEPKCDTKEKIAHKEEGKAMTARTSTPVATGKDSIPLTPPRKLSDENKPSKSNKSLKTGKELEKSKKPSKKQKEKVFVDPALKVLKKKLEPSSRELEPSGKEGPRDSMSGMEKDQPSSSAGNEVDTLLKPKEQPLNDLRLGYQQFRKAKLSK